MFILFLILKGLCGRKFVKSLNIHKKRELYAVLRELYIESSSIVNWFFNFIRAPVQGRNDKPGFNLRVVLNLYISDVLEKCNEITCNKMHYSDWLKIFNYFAQDNYCFIQTFIRSALKETLNSYFCLTQKIRGFTSLHNFPWKIKKKIILSKDIFPWLGLITEILVFLQIYQCENNKYSVFLIFQKIWKSINIKKQIIDNWFG